MNVMGYDILEEENLPEFLKKKPQWVKCMVFAGVLFVITAAAIGIGVIIGYTYCYLEYRSGIVKRNVTRRSTNVQIVHVPIQESDFANKTINGALSSAFLVSKIIQICGVITDGELSGLPRLSYKQNTNITQNNTHT